MRPYKHGLEYFPLDVDADQDSAVEFIEAKHGIVGFAVYVKLLMRIYRKGYCLKWDDRECIVLAKSTGVQFETLAAIIEDCLNERLFDRAKLDAHGILTSRSIQERYLDITKRRVNGSIPDAHSCLSGGLLSTETELLPAKTPQRKAEERKVEERESSAPEKPYGKVMAGDTSMPPCMLSPLETIDPPYSGTCIGFIVNSMQDQFGTIPSHSELSQLKAAIHEGCIPGCTGEHPADCALLIAMKLRTKGKTKFATSNLWLRCLREDRMEARQR